MKGLILFALLVQQQQGSDSTRQQLQSRGLSADIAAQISVVARQTGERGLPARAIVDKAIEGIHKRVPPPRIVAAVRDLSARLERARNDLRSGGVATPNGATITAAAEASAQGIARSDQVGIVRAAPSETSAASGLAVAAALVVQGLDPGTAARLVTTSYQNGRSAAQVLDLPAAARALQARGVAATDVGRQLLDGISATGTATGRVGATVKPVVPPVRVP